MGNKPRARVIACYLPQFHPIPENDLHWGKGFTEWTNVVQAKPLFRGHYQPKLPRDLGFYDLRLPEVREAQAKLAREAGIEGFMYWHYWFGNGDMILERPFQEVLKSGSPDFPFCLGWANHSWTTKSWKKGNALDTSKMIKEQKYPGIEDYKLHFEYVLPAFKDERYIKVNGKPVFYIWDPLSVKDMKEFINYWQQLSIEAGLPGVHFIANRWARLGEISTFLDLGFDSVGNSNFYEAEKRLSGNRLFKVVKSQLSLRTGLILQKYDYAKIIKHFHNDSEKQVNVYPSIISGFDRSPRSGRSAVIYYNYTPDLFEAHAREAVDLVQEKPYEDRIIMLKSWNEWGEGNYMEPDLKYGTEFLDRLKKVLS